jgi:hypothetical protein
MTTSPASSVWHPLAVSGSASTRMESWACPPDCHGPCPLREATFWPESRAIVNTAISALPNGRYDMRWTGTTLDTRPTEPTA